MKKTLTTILLTLSLTLSFAQEFLAVRELPERMEKEEMAINTAEVVFLAKTDDIAITTSNRSVDLVAKPIRKGSGKYEYVVILDLSGGHADRHFTVEKRGTTFRATTKRKTLFKTGERHYFYVDEPLEKVMLTQPKHEAHLVKDEACVEFFSPYSNLRVDTTGPLNLRMKNSTSASGSYVTSVFVNTQRLAEMRDLYRDSLPDYWEEITTLTVWFDNSNANSVSLAELQARNKLQYNIASVSFGSEKSSADLQELKISFSPKEATVRLDGKQLPTLNGTVSAFVSAGKHYYDIECPYYHAMSDTMNIVDGNHTLDVVLKPAFGGLDISGEGVRGATVIINGREVGTAPYKNDRMLSGNYQVELVKELYFPFSKEITISDGKVTELTESLVKNYAHITLAVENDADIYVNGEKVGHGQYSADLESGAYAVEARKSGYASTVDTLHISPAMMDKVLVLKAPIPLYGLLAIRTRPAKAVVWHNDTIVCVTPRIVRTLVGDYDLTITHNKRDTIRTHLKLESRKCMEVKAKLPRTGKLAPDDSTANLVKARFVKHHVAYIRGTLFSFNIGYTLPHNILSYGLTIGRLRRCGWSLALNSNLKFNGFEETEAPAGASVTYSCETHFSATLGLVVRTCNNLSVRVGAGYGYYAYNHKFTDGEWRACLDTRIATLQTDLGLILHINPLMITFDYSTALFKYHTFRVGIGFCIQKRPDALLKQKRIPRKERRATT